MTSQTELDLLELAEAVAAGEVPAADAEGRAPVATDELKLLTAAVDAVRAHARATHTVMAAAAVPTAADGGAVLEMPVAGARVRRRATTERRPGHGGRPVLLLVAASLLVGATAIGLALGGGLPVAPGPTPLPAVVIATPRVPAASPGPSDQTSSPIVATPTSTPPDASALFRDTKVQAIQLTPTGVGWAVEGTNLYRSTDGGTTWIDVPHRFPASPLAGALILDADTVYLASTMPPGIAVTHDGGATWLATDISDPAIADFRAIFAFQSTDVGTVSFPTRDERGLQIYRTSDGGRTWTGPWAGPNSARMPHGMDGATGGYGPDTGVIWSANGQHDGQPFDDRLAFSLDGGVTWQDRSFPIDGRVPAGTLKWVDAIRADGSGRVVLAMDMGEGPWIYTSQDFGRTWQFVKDARGSEARLLSATDWILLSENPMRSELTTDGGLTWHTVAGGSRIHLDLTSIASADEMWAVHDCSRSAGAWYPGPDPWCDNTEAKEVILVTTDGARTWTEVGQ